MSEIDFLLGFEDEYDESEYNVGFERIWRLAISGLNCERPPQVKKEAGVVLPSAFDLRVTKDEKSLSFLKLEIDSDNLIQDEEKHMEIMATVFKKDNKGDLRKNRCSITMERQRIIEATKSDPQNKVIFSDFNFKETEFGERESKFSKTKGWHWDGFYLSKDENIIIMVKSILSKCAMIVNYAPVK